MSASERNFLQRIKDYRRFVDLGSPDSDNGKMESPQGEYSVSDEASEKSPLPDKDKDSGISDPTTMFSGYDGPKTSTPKPGTSLPHGSPDCVCSIPGSVRQQFELTDEGLEGGSITTLTVERSRFPNGESHANGQYDFSDSVQVGTALFSGRPSETRADEAEPRDLPPELQGDLPCDIFYISEHSGTLQRFMTFNELSEYLVDAAVQMKTRSDNVDNVMRNLVRIPFETLGCYMTLGQYLRYLYEEDKLVDVLVHVKDMTFSAHRVALSCYSEYFADLFSFNMGRKVPFEMRLKGIFPEAFAVFLEFVYTGKLNIYDAISADLIIIADFLKVEALKQRCSELARDLPLEQALKLVVKCQGGTSGRIYKTVFHKCSQSFSAITNLPGILEMDIETLCQMLASDDLFVHSEYEVFQFVVRWIAHDVDERIKFAVRLITLIRFHYMTAEELYSCAETTSLIKQYDKFREAILKANWILTGRALNREDPFKFPMLPPRNCYMAQFFEVKASCGANLQDTFRMFTSAGCNPPSPTEPVGAKFQPDTFQRLASAECHPPSPTEPPGAKIQANTFQRLASVGYNPPSHVMSPRANLQQNSFRRMAPARCNPPVPPASPYAKLKPTTFRIFASAEYNPPSDNAPPLTSSVKHGKPVMIPAALQTQAKVPSKSIDILVIGGFTTEQDKFVERYDSEDNQWVHFCRLPEPRIHHAVALLGNTLYLIGGSDPRTPGDVSVPTSKTFSLDLTNKEWRRVADLSVARMDHCACCLSKMIFAIGGRGIHNNILGSVECYNPETDNWFFVSPLETARASASACPLGGRIFVVGGIGENNNVPATKHVLNTVEVFELSKNSWSETNNLRFPRTNACLVNVRGRLYLCGGATRSYDYKNSVLVSVASVDEYLAEHDMWCHRTDMIIPRHDAGVTVAGDRIYIIGGISSTADRVLQSVECYDTRQAYWLSGVQDLPYPTRWICCVSVLSKYHRPHRNFMNS